MQLFRSAAIVLFVTNIVVAASATSQTPAGGASLAEQVSSGQTIYDHKCSECHDGGIMGPELSGSTFSSDWNGRTVGALYEVIAKTMPADSPGTLNQAESLALVAYVLKSNSALPDDKALADPAALAALTFKSAH